MMCRAFAMLTLALSAGSAPADGAGLARARQWDRDCAAHLLRRAGFGGTPAQIDAVYRMGLDAAVDSLIDYEKIPRQDETFVAVRGPGRDARKRILAGRDETQAREIRRLLRALDRAQGEDLRAWWLKRMVTTARPLEEKMTLFWHGHFTSGLREVGDAGLMGQQNEFLRTHALADFRTLLVGISRDGAMLRYLDNASNRKQHPNENYARELLELFTMGEGHYSETDVTEAARAFTGWTYGPDGFRVARRRHDDGPKTFLGQRGPWDGEDIIDIVLQQEATATHMARRLLLFFVSDQPGDAMVRALAGELKRNRFDFRATLRRLFKSALFYDPAVRFSRVKSPVELVVGSLRLLVCPAQDGHGLAESTRAMGQDLFQPPSVAGWDGGRKWITSATLLSRYNFAAALLTGADEQAFRRRRRRIERVNQTLEKLSDYITPASGWSPSGPLEGSQRQAQPPVPLIIQAAKLRTAAETVDHFAARLLQRPLTPEQRGTLLELLGPDFDINRPGVADQVRELVHVIMCMPEYQLN